MLFKEKAQAKYFADVRDVERRRGERGEIAGLGNGTLLK